jgi:hypothetical protein
VYHEQEVIFEPHRHNWDSHRFAMNLSAGLEGVVDARPPVSPEVIGIGPLRGRDRFG